MIRAIRNLAFLITFLLASTASAQVGLQMFCGGTLDPTQQLKFVGGCSYANGVMTVTDAGGTLTSIAPDALNNLTFTPNPITTTGTIGLALGAADTWTGLHTFSQAKTGVVIGSPSGTAFGPSFTGDGGVGGNTATPVVLNISPTFNLTSTGGANATGYTAILVNATETSIGTAAKKLIDLEVGGASKFYVTNTGSWYSPLIDSGITSAGVVAVAANTILAGAAGTGGLSFNAMTGSSNFPTGDFQWQGAAGKAAVITAGAGGSITVTAAGTSTWSTSTGNLTLDAAGTLNLGSTAATQIQISAAASKTKISGGVAYQTAAVNDANYTVDGASTTDRFVYETAMSAGRTITLPNAVASNLGREVTVCNVSGSVQTITLSSNNINGAGTFAMNSAGYACTTLFSTGGLGKWIVTANY